MKHGYRHFDEDNNDSYKFKLVLDMKQVVENVDKVNYGVHRFISELIDIRRLSIYKQDLDFADELEALLNKGYF